MRRSRFDFLKQCHSRLKLCRVVYKAGFTCSKKQGDKREHHFIAKIFTEKEHAEHDPNRNDSQDWHGPFDELQNLAKLLDVGRVSINQLAREYIRPEAILALPKRDLELHLLCLVPILFEEVECVFEDRRPSLYTVIQPGSTVFFLVNRDGRRLSTTHRQALDYGDFEFVWMLSQSSSARLSLSVSCWAANGFSRTLLAIPAAPAPMMTTFFLPFFTNVSEDMFDDSVPMVSPSYFPYAEKNL